MESGCDVLPTGLTWESYAGVTRPIYLRDHVCSVLHEMFNVLLCEVVTCDFSCLRHIYRVWLCDQPIRSGFKQEFRPIVEPSNEFPNTAGGLGQPTSTGHEAHPVDMAPR